MEVWSDIYLTQKKCLSIVRSEADKLERFIMRKEIVVLVIRRIAVSSR